MSEPVTCWGCGEVLDGSSFTTEPCSMLHEGEVIKVCVVCFEELGGYDQI